MITRDQMMPLLIEACPSYREVSQRMPDEDLFYTALGDFADYLLELHQQHQAESFPAVGRVIERLHVEGDSYVQEAATIGLLEGIQNGWANKKVDPDLFLPYLLPVSAESWQSLNDFWNGKSKFVGDKP